MTHKHVSLRLTCPLPFKPNCAVFPSSDISTWMIHAKLRYWAIFIKFEVSKDYCYLYRPCKFQIDWLINNAKCSPTCFVRHLLNTHSACRTAFPAWRSSVWSYSKQCFAKLRSFPVQLNACVCHSPYWM